MLLFFFFFNDTATTEIYTLSLHDALPIYLCGRVLRFARRARAPRPGSGGFASVRRPPEQSGAWAEFAPQGAPRDRKSTRLNSSHANISYAVFCLKKKNTNDHPTTHHLPPA